MRKYLLLAILAMTAIGVHAEYNRLVFRTISGEELSVGVTGLNITFTNGELLATSESASVKIPLTSLKSMAFDNGDVSGVQAIPTPVESAVTVYSTDGICQGTFETKAAATDALPNGLYIIETENGNVTKMLINK